jgi:hypothetical protein
MRSCGPFLFPDKGRLSLLVWLGLLLAGPAHGGGGNETRTAALPQPNSAVRGASVEQPRLSALRYDYDYPVIGYSGTPVNNRVARLQARLQRGEGHLDSRGSRGYLDAVLKELNIDPGSQTLVFSKSSLQIDWINAATPRAIYFNDDTFVAWVQGSGLLELVTMDSSLGPVFYTLSNGDSKPAFEREVLRCLACHDKFSLSGGGVPLFLVMSSPVDINGVLLGARTTIPVSDDTPIEKRWAGWYVTGSAKEQSHLGNILVRTEPEMARAEGAPARNENALGSLLNTTPYMRDTSDIVALLVLEHETTVYNLMTRVNFKARSLIARELPDLPSGASWDSLPPKTQDAVRHMVEPLVEAMLFCDAAPIAGKITGSSGFDTWFESLGPRDRVGRSLRQLQLQGRLFKYPLSFLIYSEAFDALPGYAKELVYRRLADVLSGTDQSGAFAHLSAPDRTAVYEILTATKPEFARMVAVEHAGPVTVGREMY